MSLRLPRITYHIDYCGYRLQVSRREFERIQGYIARQTRLTKAATEYTDWIVSYRRKHPYYPRADTEREG